MGEVLMVKSRPTIDWFSSEVFAEIGGFPSSSGSEAALLVGVIGGKISLPSDDLRAENDIGAGFKFRGTAVTGEVAGASL